jgi:hypothetical protein
MDDAALQEDGSPPTPAASSSRLNKRSVPDSDETFTDVASKEAHGDCAHDVEERLKEGVQGASKRARVSVTPTARGTTPRSPAAQDMFRAQRSQSSRLDNAAVEAAVAVAVQLTCNSASAEQILQVLVGAGAEQHGSGSTSNK